VQTCGVRLKSFGVQRKFSTYEWKDAEREYKNYVAGSEFAALKWKTAIIPLVIDIFNRHRSISQFDCVYSRG
jgi:hypothetical protein